MLQILKRGIFPGPFSTFFSSKAIFFEAPQALMYKLYYIYSIPRDQTRKLNYPFICFLSFYFPHILFWVGAKFDSADLTFNFFPSPLLFCLFSVSLSPLSLTFYRPLFFFLPRRFHLCPEFGYFTHSHFFSHSSGSSNIF